MIQLIQFIKKFYNNNTQNIHSIQTIYSYSKFNARYYIIKPIIRVYTVENNRHRFFFVCLVKTVGKALTKSSRIVQNQCYRRVSR